jgi:hypothetical protein
LYNLLKKFEKGGHIYSMTEKGKKESGVISRRDFLKDAGLLVGGAAVGSTILMAACKGEPETTTITSTAPGTTATVTGPGSTVTETAPGATVTSTAPGTTVTQTQTVTSTVTRTPTTTAAIETELTVKEPTGEASIEIKYLHAERLATLDNAVIALMACAPQKWQPHRILPYAADLIAQEYPTATFIPQTEFTQGTGIDSEEDAEKAVSLGVTAMVDAFAA